MKKSNVLLSQPTQRYLSILIPFKSYLIVGSIGAVFFPFIGLATSYINIAYLDEYNSCKYKQEEADSNHEENLLIPVKWYSCWYYTYTIAYYLILFKPFQALYKISGIYMTLLIGIGYVGCFMNIAFIANSECRETNFGKVSSANTLIFIAVASFIVIFTHLLAFVQGCKALCGQCCKRSPQQQQQDQQQRDTRVDNSTSQLQKKQEEEKKEEEDIDEVLDKGGDPDIE